MKTKPVITVTYLATGLLALGALGALTIAPIAAAESVFPAAGDESASATIDDLRAQGYDVRVNYVTGTPNVPLYECKVSDINNPSAPSVPPSKATVYLNVVCPSVD
jgi:hypothetical protein